MELLKQQVEALIFCSEQSISLSEINAALKVSFDWDPTDEELMSVISEIKAKYESDDFSFELLEISEGFQFLTKKQYHPAISALIQNKAKKKLSVAQMETLAIIAYRQPISKAEVEHIRGVSCDYAIQKLLEKEMIEISGKSDGPGRPILYSTSRLFMDYFAIKTVKDLPQLKDLHVEQNEIGISSDYSDSENQLNESGTEEAEGLAPTPVEENAEAINSEEYISESTVEVISEISTDEMPSIAGMEEDLELPDRKSIFLENEQKVEDTLIQDENSEIQES